MGDASGPDLLEVAARSCLDESAVLSARRADLQLPPAEHTSPAKTRPYASFLPNALKNDRPGCLLQYRVRAIGELIRSINGKEHAVLRDTPNDRET